jgi:predicted ester cyclase
MMSAADVVKGFIAAFESGNVDEAANYLADNFTFSGPVPQPMNKAAYIVFMNNNLLAFSDFKLNASDIHEHGNVVHTNIQITGTNDGELRLPMPGAPSIAPTGKKIKLAVQNPEFTVKGDKIVSIIDVPSPDAGLPGIMKQLGLKMP